MNDNIKMIILPGNQNRDGNIDFIFYPLDKENNPDYIVKTLSKEEDIKKINLFENYNEQNKYKKSHIYHFDCLRNYLKNYYEEIYYKLRLDDPIYENMNDSYVEELLNISKKLTLFDFVPILNTNSLNIIYVNNNISEYQRRELEIVKELINEKSIVQIVVCNGLDIINIYNGTRKIIDNYLNELQNKKIR